MWVAASRYSRDHFISEKYKTTQSFKAYYLPNCPLVQLYISASVYKGVWNITANYFVKNILFSSSVAFLMMSVASQKRRPFNADFSRAKRQKLVGAMSEVYGRFSSVVTLFFAKRSLTKTDQCAGALSWRRNQLLILHVSRSFLPTAPLRRRRMSIYISLFTAAIPVNYTSYCRKRLEATTCHFSQINSIRKPAVQWNCNICWPL